MCAAQKAILPNCQHTEETPWRFITLACHSRNIGDYLSGKYMHELFQFAAALILAVGIHSLLYTAIRKRFPRLSDNMTGTISWFFACLAVILLALLIYPHGWR